MLFRSCIMVMKHVIRFSSTIGFIGVGNMGSRMCNNLIEKGEKIIIYDANTSALEPFSARNDVLTAKSIQDVAAISSLIITMLPNNEIVSSVYKDEDGLILNCHKGTTLVDCSTVDPKVSQNISAFAEENECDFLDAPVSGGVQGAAAGKLSFMVGGPETSFKKIEPVLLKMGARTFYCGKSGMGEATKLCNNMLLASTMIAAAETLNLGVRFGLDPKMLVNIINVSSGRCWATDVNSPVPGVLINAPSNQDYKGGFKTDLILKDVNLALSLAESTNSRIILAKQTREIYKNVSDDGFGDYDFSIVYKYLLSNKNH